MAGPYCVELGYVAKKTATGKRFNYGTNGWDDLDRQSVAELLALAQEGQDLVVRRKDEDGVLTVTLSVKVLNTEGGDVPPELANMPDEVFTGITLHGWTTIEDNLKKVGDALTKKGRAHAIKKEGKPKKQEDDTPAA